MAGRGIETIYFLAEIRDRMPYSNSLHHFHLFFHSRDIFRIKTCRIAINLTRLEFTFKLQRIEIKYL